MRVCRVALLAAVDWVDRVRGDRLGLSDSALSKQLRLWREAGYIAIERHVGENGVGCVCNSRRRDAHRVRQPVRRAQP